MKRFAGLALAAALVVGGTVACSESAHADANYVGVCVDRNGNRVDDSQCRSSADYYPHSGMADFMWGYLVANALMPSYGSRVTNYVTYVDTNSHNVYRGGVPRTGGTLNFQTYRPLYSKVTKPNVSLKSETYNNLYNKSPNYVKPSVRAPSQPKSGTSYNKSGSGGYKAPSGGFRRK